MLIWHRFTVRASPHCSPSEKLWIFRHGRTVYVGTYSALYTLNHFINLCIEPQRVCFFIVAVTRKIMVTNFLIMCGALNVVFVPMASLVGLLLSSSIEVSCGNSARILVKRIGHSQLRHQQYSCSFFWTCLVFCRSPKYILYSNCQDFFLFQRSTSTAKFVTCTTP
jgi:hypothetical protein